MTGKEAVAQNDLQAADGRELTIKALDCIWPPKQRGKALPSLAERRADEKKNGMRRRPIHVAVKKTTGEGPRPRFINEEGHPFEHVGYMGKRSPITRAKRKPEGVDRRPAAARGGPPTLADRVKTDGIKAYRSSPPKKNP